MISRLPQVQFDVGEEAESQRSGHLGDPCLLPAPQRPGPHPQSGQVDEDEGGAGDLAGQDQLPRRRGLRTQG